MQADPHPNQAWFSLIDTVFCVDNIATKPPELVYGGFLESATEDKGFANGDNDDIHSSNRGLHLNTSYEY